jgi:phosphoribosylaminoimidazolecarboxamide formyltransferase / IMP cyclohydrolase
MMTPDKQVRITRALLSVSDKTGLVEFAKGLAAHGVELLSTGGTAKVLREAGLSVKDVSEHTGFPEMMDGRVKTLHPKIHGGFLALRDNAEHVAAMQAHEIAPIDLVVVNLYPFEATVAKGAAYDEVIENIDIGGPAMVRSAAKNHGFVAIVTDPADYARVLAEMNAADGATTYALRQQLAAKAYARTAQYDAAISSWFAFGALGQMFPDTLNLSMTKAQDLRYGENPHQQAAVYHAQAARHPNLLTARQVQGKELSYNNLNDADAAFELISEFDARTPAVAIIKHANPCGVATGASVADAYARAFACDTTSAFGGIIAVNQPLDEATARAITEIFTEVVIAPEADDAAKAVFAAKKNLRLLLTGSLRSATAPGLTIKSVSGGYLLQSRDNKQVTPSDVQVVSKRAPTDDEMRDLLFAFQVAKHVKSNAIVYAKNSATVGIGAGQMNRLNSSQIAARKAADMGLETRGSVVASDAFFPFADGLIAAADAGVTAIIQPGGSMRDAEVIAAADERNLAMVFTGVRHFRH